MFRFMPEIKIVLYKDNRAPRSIALSTQTLYKTMFLTTTAALLLLLSTGAAVKYYLAARAKAPQEKQSGSSAIDDSDTGPGNSIEAQNKALRDEVDQLHSRLQNAAATLNTPREIDKKNPALALFSPIVLDRTHEQDLVLISNIKATHNPKDRTSTLTFELHNTHAGESTQKGYIIVLGRGDSGLLAYPNAFNIAGPYLIDFEKGETFQVARFRMVNAQFEGDARNFQILIFTRNGNLLVNTMYEEKSSGT